MQSLSEKIAAKRIANILKKSRVSYSKHLEVKISEAGPPKMRVEPHVINQTLKKLLHAELIKSSQPTAGADAKIFLPSDFGMRGDEKRKDSFLDWRELFVKYSQQNEYCGLVLESLIYKTVLQNNDKYTVIGSGPIYNDDKVLIKPTGSEILHYGGNSIYGHEHGAGFDLFIQHRDTGLPIGIEAKNKREWIYPASLEVWKLIARATTLGCLPVMISRKISYIATVGFFHKFGILGFQTHHQYLDNRVNALSDYKFKANILHAERLGFHDIQLIKDSTPPPNHINEFFSKILDEQVETYYERFMTHKNLLKRYAIDYGMADSTLNQRDRYRLYKEFKEESEYDDPEDL